MPAVRVASPAGCWAGIYVLMILMKMLWQLLTAMTICKGHATCRGYPTVPNANAGALVYALVPAKARARLPTWVTGKYVMPPDEVAVDHKHVASTLTAS